MIYRPNIVVDCSFAGGIRNSHQLILGIEHLLTCRNIRATMLLGGLLRYLGGAPSAIPVLSGSPRTIWVEFRYRLNSLSDSPAS